MDAGGAPRDREEDRLGRRRSRHSAGGRRHRSARDADRCSRTPCTPFIETLQADPRGARRQHDLRRVEHVFGMPGPSRARRRVPRDRREPRTDERDHGRPLAAVRRGGAGRRLAARPRRVGRDAGSRRYRAQAGGGGRRDAHRRRGRAWRSGRRRARRLRFLEARPRRACSARRGCRAGRPSSTRRAGTRSRSTRPAAATAPARSARCGSSTARSASRISIRARSRPDELADGWRLACRANAHDDLVVEVPPLQTRPKAALAGVGRHVILRPAVQKRHLVLDEPTLEDQVVGSRARVRGDG